MSKKFDFLPVFNAALVLIKHETGCAVWEESGRMRINETNSQYNFYESQEEFFNALDEMCKKMWKDRKISYYTYELLCEIFKMERERLIGLQNNIM